MAMSPIILLSGIALLAFFLQAFLGFQQMKHFGNEYTKMRKDGRVAIGRRPGKIMSGTIVMFSLDKEGNIQYGRLLQGTTILARFKNYSNFDHDHIEEITTDNPKLKKEISITRKAIIDAVNNYQLIVNGKEIPQKQAPLNRLFSNAKNKMIKGVS